MSPSGATALFMPDRESVRLVFALTERERQVLVLIAGGKSTKEAASQLGISYKTADSHRSRILEKLGVHETGEHGAVRDPRGPDRGLSAAELGLACARPPDTKYCARSGPGFFQPCSSLELT